MNYNMMFSNLAGKKDILSRSSEFYGNFFVLVASTQVLITEVVKAELRHRETSTLAEYQAKAKFQQLQVCKSVQDLIEEFAKQYFELFDDADYLKSMETAIDPIRRNQIFAQSPYSLLRQVARKRKQTEFQRFFFNEAFNKKRELVCVKPYQAKQYLSEVLETKWGIKADELSKLKKRSNKKISKLKQKRDDK